MGETRTGCIVSYFGFILKADSDRTPTWPSLRCSTFSNVETKSKSHDGCNHGNFRDVLTAFSPLEECVAQIAAEE